MRKLDNMAVIPNGAWETSPPNPPATHDDNVDDGIHVATPTGARSDGEAPACPAQATESATRAADSAPAPVGASPLHDMSRFRLSQSYGAAAPVKKLLITVPVRKPHRQEFVRTSESLVFETVTFTTSDDGCLYLVEPNLIDAFPEPLRPTALVGTMNRQHVFYWWPVFLQAGDQPWNEWHRSAYLAMQQARRDWVRVSSNRALGAYETSVALVTGLPEPEWPELALEELLAIAFRDNVIDTADHPVLKMLRGEA
jgi:hypothetical protein